MKKMKELLKELIETYKNEEDGTSLSIHIEGEEDFSEVVIYPDTTVTFDEDSVLIKTFWFDTSEEEKKNDNYLFRLNKIVSAVLA